MPEQKIGMVTHYFDKIGVGVVKLSAELKVGDKIRVDAVIPFVQTVTSMQVKHKNIDSAKAGDDIAMKMDKPCDDKDNVVKIS